MTRGCITEPPKPLPVVPSTEIVAGGSNACPSEYGACLSVGAVVALQRSLRDLSAYAELAWQTCSEEVDQ